MEVKKLLPDLKSLKPKDDSLEHVLMLLLGITYHISDKDAEIVHQFGMAMFQEGYVTGAELVATLIKDNTK
jgi:hypothetical protein